MGVSYFNQLILLLVIARVLFSGKKLYSEIIVLPSSFSVCLRATPATFPPLFATFLFA